jgi:glycosyltransferase involved in cell wall biosynthesis
MPCYNAGRWIGEALKSVATQTLPCHEIVVIDDGSTDDSLEKIAASGVHVRVIKTYRANAAGARNAGIEAARGKWVAFLDADDIWYPSHLQSACDLVGNTQDVAYLAHCDLLLHDQGREVKTPPYSVAKAQSGLNDVAFLRLWSEKTHFPNCGVVARRDHVLDVGGFDTVQVRRHDFELFMRLVKGHTWAYNPVPQWRYREGTPDAISRNEANCWYFTLRGVLKNEPAYRGPIMNRLLRKYAKAAMTTAYLKGNDADRYCAWELARSHLGVGRSLFSLAVGMYPRLFPMIYQAARGA